MIGLSLSVTIVLLLTRIIVVLRSRIPLARLQIALMKKRPLKKLGVKIREKMPSKTLQVAKSVGFVLAGTAIRIWILDWIPFDKSPVSHFWKVILVRCVTALLCSLSRQCIDGSLQVLTECLINAVQKNR